MRIPDAVIPYLAGERFSEGLVFPIAKVGASVDRLTLLERLASAKRVIHVGCVDHLSVLDTKIAQDIWLHGRLMRVAERCLGVDIDADGVDRLRERGIDDVLVADLTADVPDEIATATWDLVIAGEVLEHVDDPIGFLRGLRQRLSPQVADIVVTVPNALSWLNVLEMLRGRERINSDHRFWFTPYTLAKAFTLAGITPTEFFLCPSFPRGAEGTWRSKARGLVRDGLMRLAPAGNIDLVMAGRMR